MGLRTLIMGLLERKRFQSMVDLEEKYLYHQILKNQLEALKLTLKEMKRNENVERLIRKRKSKGYIC